MTLLRVGEVLKAVFGILIEVRFLGRGLVGWWLLFVAARSAAWFFQHTSGEAKFWIEIAAPLTEIVAAAAVAIGTHRFILLKENPKPAPELTALQWRYFVRSLYVLLPAILVWLAVIVTQAITRVDIIGSNFALAIIVAITAMLIVPRSLALPALAIGRNDFSVRQSVESTDHNIFRLIIIYVIVSAAVGLCEQASIFAVSALGSDEFASGFQEILITPTSSILSAMLGAAALSYSYAGLVEHDSRFASPKTDGATQTDAS